MSKISTLLLLDLTKLNVNSLFESVRNIGKKAVYLRGNTYLIVSNTNPEKYTS